MLTRRAWLTGALVTTAGLTASCDRKPSPGPGPAPFRAFSPGRRPTEHVQADVIVYGATPAGVVAAHVVAAQGHSVALIGGWRERHLGGLMSGGLGWTDYLDAGAFGGLAERTIKTISDANSHGAYELTFLPDHAERHFEALLGRRDTPVYWSDGVDTVEKTNATIKSFTTHDGLQVTGRVFIDASYAGGLLTKARVSYRTGREAADRSNTLGGYRGSSHDGGGGNHQFSIRGQFLRVDPFNRPGVPESGLIAGVSAAPAMRIGQADQAIQAYNFRLCMTPKAELRQDLPSTPPAGYDKGQYEALFRYIEAIEKSGRQYGRDWSFGEDLILANDLGGGVYDVNARGGFSTDPFGLSWGYPKADRFERERIWKAHEAYTRGFFYTLAWEKDPRLPAGLQADVRAWGLVKTQFQHPAPGDEKGWPYQLYVREAARMEGELVWTGADLEAEDGRSPRSSDIIAMASYREDSHHVQRLAVETPEGWALWNEGNLEADAGGRDGRSPLPYGIITPHRGECENLLVPFCVSATHQAFSAIRMELTAMTLGQAAGAAAAIICDQSAPLPVQDVPYPLLRARLLNDNAVLTERNGAEILFDNLAFRVRRKLTSRLPR